MTQGSTDADDDSEWRFGVDDVGPEADDKQDADSEPDQIDRELTEPDPIEPESISLEHAAFVVLGIMLTLAVMATAL